MDKKRLELLQTIPGYANGFVLGGGTGLALQIAHRKSFDFDFFSASPITTHLLETLSVAIPVVHIAVDSNDELTFFTGDDIKVTFLHYPFTPHWRPIDVGGGLSLFPVKEIAVQKAYTIDRRGEYRDYFDAYTILHRGDIDLAELIAAAHQVYGNLFDEKMFMQQLVYFDDLTSFDIIPASAAALPQPRDVRQYLQDAVRRYLSAALS